MHYNICFGFISNLVFMLDDEYRPYLMSFDKNRNDYINAVMVPVSICSVFVLASACLFMSSCITVISEIVSSFDYNFLTFFHILTIVDFTMFS